MARALDSEGAMDLDGPWTQAAFWDKPLADAADADTEAAPVRVQDLQAYLAPQLAKAPFPIVTLFDFLWWINYSLKWQHVSLRLLHCHETISKKAVKRLHHL